MIMAANGKMRELRARAVTEYALKMCLGMVVRP
jgi:hypothetical protein